MGDILKPTPALLVMAAFSRHDEALDWAQRTASDAWGGQALTSARFRFEETTYYEASMGPGLLKQFFAFVSLLDPRSLADLKHRTNAWEVEYAALGRHNEPRPLNMDPGYLTLGKLVLASTKDHSHRIYLQQGIYAEVTLYYQDHQWRHRDWTFPDYRRADYQAFFTECREYLQARLREEGRA